MIIYHIYFTFAYSHVICSPFTFIRQFKAISTAPVSWILALNHDHFQTLIMVGYRLNLSNSNSDSDSPF